MNSSSIKLNAELSRFSAWTQISEDMRTEILNRAQADGFQGVKNALDSIFDDAEGDPQYQRIPEQGQRLYGIKTDYTLFGAIWEKCDKEIRSLSEWTPNFKGKCEICEHADIFNGIPEKNTCKYLTWKNNGRGRVMPLAKAQDNCPMMQ